MDTPVIDPAKVEAFAMRTIGDLSAGYTGVMVSLGTRLRPTDPGAYRPIRHATVMKPGYDSTILEAS